MKITKNRLQQIIQEELAKEGVIGDVGAKLTNIIKSPAGQGAGIGIVAALGMLTSAMPGGAEPSIGLALMAMANGITAGALGGVVIPDAIKAAEGAWTKLGSAAKEGLKKAGQSLGFDDIKIVETYAKALDEEKKRKKD